MNRNVIVFGATGKTGACICTELENNNIPYSVFVRKESSKKITDTSIKIITGDVLNAQDVQLAFIDKKYTDVIVALGSKDLKKSNIRSIGTKHIVNAIKDTQPNTPIHIISALGVGNSWDQLKGPAKLMCKVLISNTMKDHNKQEEFVTNNTYPYHIIRPVGLKDGDSTGVHVQNEGYLPSNSIQRVDVAQFLVQSLLDDKRGFSGICQKG